MASKKLEIQIRGTDEDNGDVQFDEFIKQLEAVKKTLSEMDRVISERDSVYFRVVDLRHNSPALIVLEAVPLNQEVDNSFQIIDKFVTTLTLIETQTEAPQDIDFRALQSFKYLTSTLGNKITEIKFSSDGTSVPPLTVPLGPKIDFILGNDEFEDGSITGDLEQINIHNSQNVFTIYPTDGGAKIRCLFPNELKPKAIQALGYYVTVYGRLKYKKRGLDPYEMIVEEIETHNDKIVRLSDLRGIAPDLLNGKSSEELIWEIRNEWE